MKVIYDTTENCKRCPYNQGHICLKLGKYLFDICFEKDCPLPELSEVEQFTRYITKDKKLECHGNCKNWRRWHYNKYLKTDEGVCCNNPGLCVCMASDEACEEFDEL